jgi:hypothetical protein
VNRGGDFHEALDVAQSGDTMVLESGVTFTDPVALSNKRFGSLVDQDSLQRGRQRQEVSPGKDRRLRKTQPPTSSVTG